MKYFKERILKRLDNQVVYKNLKLKSKKWEVQKTLLSLHQNSTRHSFTYLQCVSTPYVLRHGVLRRLNTFKTVNFKKMEIGNLNLRPFWMMCILVLGLIGLLVCSVRLISWLFFSLTPDWLATSWPGAWLAGHILAWCLIGWPHLGRVSDWLAMT